MWSTLRSTTALRPGSQVYVDVLSSFDPTVVIIAFCLFFLLISSGYKPIKVFFHHFTIFIIWTLLTPLLRYHLKKKHSPWSQGSPSPPSWPCKLSQSQTHLGQWSPSDFIFVRSPIYELHRDHICHKQRLCKIIITRVKVHFVDVF